MESDKRIALQQERRTEGGTGRREGPAAGGSRIEKRAYTTAA